MSAASFFISLGVRIAALVAIGQNWGWGWAALLFIALLVIRAPKTSWGAINYNSGMVYVRQGLEIVILIAGLIAASYTWGPVWAATMLIIWVIGFVTRSS